MKYFGDSFLEVEDLRGRVDLHTTLELASKYNYGTLSFPEFQQMMFDPKTVILSAIKEIGVNRVLFGNNMKDYDKYRKVLENKRGFNFSDKTPKAPESVYL